jgi:CHAD domain-containing protein
MARPPRYGDVRADDPLQTLANAVLQSLAHAMHEQAPAALEGVDVEAVHDMRVAIRRLRSALDAFDGCYPHRRRDAVAHAMRRLGRRLGAVRDADVHLGVLRSALAGATDAERPGIAYAIEQLGERRRNALARFAIVYSQHDRGTVDRLTHGE